jgi:hypothetical protein
MSDPVFSREQIYSALFTLVAGAAEFVTATRRIREYADVDQSTQPALLQSELGETWNAPPGMPPLVVLNAKLFLYCESGDPTAVVSTQINTLLDAVTQALAPPSDGEERQTLGGLVFHCRIAGDVTIAEGLSGQSEAVVPIEILVNS